MHLLPAWCGRTDLWLASKAPKEAAPTLHTLPCPTAPGEQLGAQSVLAQPHWELPAGPSADTRQKTQQGGVSHLLPSCTAFPTPPQQDLKPEGSALDLSLPTAASGNWLTQSLPCLPGAGMEAARNP